LTSAGAADVLKARANVTLQQERYNTALDYVTNSRPAAIRLRSSMPKLHSIKPKLPTTRRKWRQQAKPTWI